MLIGTSCRLLLALLRGDDDFAEDAGLLRHQ